MVSSLHLAVHDLKYEPLKLRDGGHNTLSIAKTVDIARLADEALCRLPARDTSGQCEAAHQLTASDSFKDA